MMIWAIYRPVQVLYDANVAFCFLLFCPQSLARMGYAGFIALCCMLVPVTLKIVDHWMWLDANNGNANYMFFQCLAYNVFLGMILGQFTSASMQRDKSLRLTLESDQKVLKSAKR
jgi:phosphatidylinositol glycan class U